MKPKRIAMAHELIVNYGLYKELNVYVFKASKIIGFHVFFILETSFRDP